MEYAQTFELPDSGLKNTTADKDELWQKLEVLEEWLLSCL